MSPNRARLAALAAAAGYPNALLVDIALATLPHYQHGQALGDADVELVALAVEVLAQAGHNAETASALIARHRPASPDTTGRWRDRLWAEALTVANHRYAHPDQYGLSPCEHDADRLARHPAPTRGAHPSRKDPR